MSEQAASVGNGPACHIWLSASVGAVGRVGVYQQVCAQDGGLFTCLLSCSKTLHHFVIMMMMVIVDCDHDLAEQRGKCGLLE